MSRTACPDCSGEGFIFAEPGGGDCPSCKGTGIENGGSTESERWYDDYLAPILLSLGKECEARSIPFVALVGYDTPEGLGSVGRTQVLPAQRPPFFDVIYAAAQCVEGELGGFNIDKFMFHMMKVARKEGHTSMILHQLGVPIKEAPRSVGGSDVVLTAMVPMVDDDAQCKECCGTGLVTQMPDGHEVECSACEGSGMEEGDPEVYEEQWDW